METLMDSIDRMGWGVKTKGFSAAASRRLMTECADECERGGFRQARVGRGGAREVREEIRGDQVLWLQPEGTSVEQVAYLAELEILRLALNRRFFLGLFAFEGHFAIYPIGAFYKPHLDRHAGTSERIITVILYLNPDWQPGD